MSSARRPNQYTGVRPINPPNVIYADRAPTSTDVAYRRGDFWLNEQTSSSYQYNGAGNWISVGVGTDLVGQATLVAGTITVANTSIAAGDKIFPSRHGINGSTAVGVFNYSINAGVSFTITALNPTDATTQTNDVSIVDYFILKQA